MTHTKQWYEGWTKPELKNGMNERGYWIDHVEDFHMGFGVDLSRFTYVNALNGVWLEDKVQIGQHCSILSTTTIGECDDAKVAPIVIREGAVVGSHSTIMPGVTIGRNAIVGAYSYIDKDIPEDCKYITKRVRSR